MTLTTKVFAMRKELSGVSLAGMGTRAAALALLVAGLAACATGPTYRPRGPGDTVGYTDQRLTQNRFRVTFAGGTASSREFVEDSLLRRSAEVTLQNGFTHFVFDTRDTEARTYYRNAFGPRTSFGLGFGSGRFRGPFYWSSFAFGDPFFDRDLYPVSRYEAYAEIVMLNPQQATSEPDAIDAREVLNSLPPPPPPPGAARG